jgi:hypothetical protein
VYTLFVRLLLELFKKHSHPPEQKEIEDMFRIKHPSLVGLYVFRPDLEKVGYAETTEEFLVNSAGDPYS